MNMKEEIDNKVKELEQRIVAGEDVLKQCKKQLRMLKLRLKHIENIKQQPIYIEVSDGDL